MRSERNYRRMWLNATLSIALVSIGPLLVMTYANHRQYQQAIEEERTRPISRLTASSARSLEFFLDERQSALEFVVREMPHDVLCQEDQLERLLRNLKASFGGFVDLGVIDSEGRQVAYAGPYSLRGQAYRDEDWYEEVLVRGAYTSEVFMGHRHLPHFVIAIRHDDEGSGSYILRASIDTGTLDHQIRGMGAGPGSDAFIIDHDGTLQTPSAMFGAALDRCPLPVPPYSHDARVIDEVTPDGETLLVGYAYIEHSPFVLILVSRQQQMDESWASLRRDLLAFLAVSIVLILAVVIWGTTTMIQRLARADRRRAALYHQAEYNNKMAAIGRLAAGVAHEINNPLAIINERAGLMRDLLRSPDHRPSDEKLDRQVGSILDSVERCAAITHRLLGFARHMDLHNESIDLEMLIEQVYGFLERETRYREVRVTITAEEDLPQITSDRGQLQQVFLNILNNALAAVDQGGTIDVRLHSPRPGLVAVCVADDGVGIPAEDLDHIFEPFYSTKGNEGTGLGLSITYGIVSKLGGTVDVESEVGVGTTFTVTLPVSRGDKP